MLASSSIAAEQKAYFSGGCYWCMEAEFQQTAGVSTVTSGFAEPQPAGKTPVEAVEVLYKPEIISYEKLLEIYWSNIDPFDEGGQFYDRGHKYTTAIYYQTEAEKTAALHSKENIKHSLGKTPVTRIEAFGSFVPVPASEQDFFLNNPERYQGYVKGSRRKESLQKIWQP